MLCPDTRQESFWALILGTQPGIQIFKHLDTSEYYKNIVLFAFIVSQKFTSKMGS